jgi:hypothetical protein
MENSKHILQRTRIRHPNGHWTIENQRKFFDALADKLHIKNPEDWSHVRLKTIIAEGGSFVSYLHNESIVKGTLICEIYWIFI